MAEVFRTSDIRRPRYITSWLTYIFIFAAHTLQIGSIVLLETLNSAFAMTYSYNRLVLNFGTSTSYLFAFSASFWREEMLTYWCCVMLGNVADNFAQSVPTWRKYHTTQLRPHLSWSDIHLHPAHPRPYRARYLHRHKRHHRHARPALLRLARPHTHRQHLRRRAYRVIRSGFVRYGFLSFVSSHHWLAPTRTSFVILMQMRADICF